MPKKKTHEEYVDEVKNINSNIEVVGEYVNAKTKILHRCKIDDYEWFIKPTHVLDGVGCPKCAGLKKKTHEEYVYELSIKNPDIEVIDKYKNVNTKIMHHCLIHNVYWETAPISVLMGNGCEICRIEKIRNSQRKLHEQYIKEVSIINPNIEVIENYINAKTPILHRCKIHNIKWKVTPDTILHDCGCLECAKEKVKIKLCKTHEQYVEDLKEANPDIDVIGKYISATTPILHKCKLDGYEWYITPNHALAKRGCPKCSESMGERNVRKWLEGNKIQYISQKTFDGCKDKQLLLFDFYLPEHNICIEYQGRQHYEPIDYFGGENTFKVQQKHDNIKKEYCKENNIKLLEIHYNANIEETLNNFLFI